MPFFDFSYIIDTNAKDSDSMTKEQQNIAQKQAAPKLFCEDKVFHGDELIQSYYHRFQNFGAMDMHAHNFYELNVIIQGQGIHHINDKVFTVKKGMAFLIPPYIPHDYIFENNDYIIFHILFHNLFFDKYNKQLNAIEGFHLLFDIEPYVRLHRENSNFPLLLDANKFAAIAPSFKRLVLLENESGYNTQQKKDFLTLYILSEICENLKDFVSTGKENDESLFSVLKAAEYMQNHYSEKITLSKLCSEASMSRSSFLRHFKNSYNCTPSEYLNDYRINQSKILLRETDKSIATIAQNCGFFDSSHFIRILKKKVGVSPVKYREKFIQ